MNYMQAFLRGAIHCGKCGYCMIYTGKLHDSVFPAFISCTNPTCTENGVLYRTPSIVLERVS